MFRRLLIIVLSVMAFGPPLAVYAFRLLELSPVQYNSDAFWIGLNGQRGWNFWRSVRNTPGFGIFVNDGRTSFHIQTRLDPPRILPRREQTIGPFDYRMRNRTSGRIIHDRNVRFTTISASNWVFPVVFATYPLLAFLFGPVRRYSRAWRGRCLRCGYRLTGLPANGDTDCAARLCEPVHERLRLGWRRTPGWLIRGAVFGALAPWIYFTAQIAFPDRALFDSNRLLLLVTLPAERFGFVGWGACYVANILLCAMLFAGLAFLCTAFLSTPVRRILLTPIRPHDFSGPRCPECGTVVALPNGPSVLPSG